ncbi:MAG TPA: M48 family metallopeptidase [Rhizomicrobium sp.]|nr:M48 family metallopeptidase [Rhizomicrobium sp.]
MRGRYFFPLSARCVDAQAEAAGATLTITGEDGVVLASLPLNSVRATSRLGSMRRRMDFPDGASFDTEDNDAVDALQCRSGILHRLERSWRTALASVLVAGLAIAAFVVYGVPATAGWLARHTPPSVAAYTTRQTLDAMDRVALNASKTPPSVRQHYLGLFAGVAAQAPRGASGYHLQFRDAPAIGPNAFALPDGTVILTDQMIPLVKRDEEIEGVFAHEMSHVDHAHGLQRIYQASLVPAAIAFITGDASQLGHFAAILPGILLQSAYSRAFEQQADDDAAALLRRMGKNPAPLADLLERMEKKMCGGSGGCGPNWLGSHPATYLRAQRLRHF